MLFFSDLEPILRFWAFFTDSSIGKLLYAHIGNNLPKKDAS
jgi:hypothetical protein